MRDSLHPSSPISSFLLTSREVCVGKPKSRSQRAVEIWALGEKRRDRNSRLVSSCARYFAYSHASGLGMHTNLGASADPITC